jgi:class 3 adenylate cyclase
MPRQIADRLSQAAGASFFGRGAELALFHGAIESAELPFVIIFIHGPGGIGKSCLVNAMLRSVDSGVRAIALDCRAIEPTPKGLLGILGSALGMQEQPDLPSVAAILGETSQRTVLVLDTYETFALMDTWLRQVFVPALPDSVLTVICGRQPPNVAWLTTPGWGGLFREIDLRELPDREAQQMLLSCGLTDDQARRINHFAHGHPLALQLAVAAIRTQPDLNISGPSFTVLKELTQAFLDGLSPETLSAVEAASTVRRLTEPILRTLLALDDVRSIFDSLRDLPFVDVTTDGLIFHDVVRDTTAANLAHRDRERYRTYRRRAWHFFTRESHRTEASSLWQCTADLLYLIENPVVREAFFPDGASEYIVEPSTVADGKDIIEIANSEDSGGSARLIAGWWQRHPETFTVVKGRGGKITAFYILFDPAKVDAQLLMDDPLTAAWSGHLEMNPVAPGERVLFLRRWLARTTGELPSPPQAACWLDIKRTYMELRPSLRRLYTTVMDLASYGPIVLPLGFVRLEQEDVAIGEKTYHSAFLDFGELSVDGWLATRVGNELGVESEEFHSRVEAKGLVTILFTDIVGSTTLTQRLGDAKARKLLRVHDTIVRGALEKHNGSEIKHTGDGIMASFYSASQALECAIATQKACARHFQSAVESIQIRIGLNAGEPISEDKDLFGTAVQLAARVCAQAVGGQILVSDVMRQLVSGKGFIFSDRGYAALRGFEDPVRLHEVLWKAESWKVKGLYVEACNCESICPCYSGRPPTYGFCEGNTAWHIKQGRYGDIPLEGLTVIMVLRCDGHMRETKWKCWFYIDDRTTSEQFDALKQIFTGAGGGHLGKIFGPLWDVQGVERAKIEFRIEGTQHRVSIIGKLLLAFGLLKPDAGPVLCRIPNSPGIGAIAEEYWFDDGKMKFDYSGKSALTTTFEYHSDQ